MRMAFLPLCWVFKITSRISPTTQTRGICLDQLWFIEPEQNDVAVEMVRLFCEENGYPFGSVLRIGSGEAILATPFQFLVRRKIKKLAKCVATHRRQNLRVTMPITKKMFLRASTIYWVNYGKKNGITKEQMECMQIEDGTFDS